MQIHDQPLNLAFGCNQLSNLLACLFIAITASGAASRNGGPAGHHPGGAPRDPLGLRRPPAEAPSRCGGGGAQQRRTAASAGATARLVQLRQVSVRIEHGWNFGRQKYFCHLYNSIDFYWQKVTIGKRSYFQFSLCYRVQ